MLESTRLLRDLVRLPSVNPMGRELAGPEFYEYRVTAYLEEFFRDLGVPYERQPVAALRENIVAWCDLPGPGPTLVFEVHQDTVPTDQMTIDPFGAVIKDGKLYGRGACDVKGGMAAMLTAFTRLTRERPPGCGRVVMACSVDEEATFLGVQRLLKTDLKAGRLGPLFAVVAEPTKLNIVNAHKGVARWILHTHGKSCHSSRPQDGINAIYHMAEVLLVIKEYADTLSLSISDERLGSPTLSVGRIEGGMSVNTVPAQCRIEIDRRLLPTEDPQAVHGDFVAWLLQRLDPKITVECPKPWMSLPPLAPVGSKELVDRLGAAIDSVVGTHQVMAVPYGTDGGPMSAAGIPCVVFGPGDIAQAHTCDEWIDLDEVEKAGEILYRLAAGS